MDHVKSIVDVRVREASAVARETVAVEPAVVIWASDAPVVIPATVQRSKRNLKRESLQRMNEEKVEHKGHGLNDHLVGLLNE